MRAGERVAGRFEVERLVGSGGMGRVYLAHDAETGAPVAIKVLLGEAPELFARFEREVYTLARLEHPAIVRYVSHGRCDDGAPFLAMQWLDGEDLAARLERGALEPAEAVALARSVAEALGHAHARGVIHRDVKPSNLFLPGRDLGRVTLLDFGIARWSAGPGAQAATRTGATLGTPGYMSPEQARGDKTVDARTDVFALGCVLYECLSGRAAFSGVHVMAVLAKVLLDEPPPLRELCPWLSEELDALLRAALSKDPAGRPAEGASFARALASLAPLGGGGDVLGTTLGSSAPRRTGLSDAEQRLVSVVAVSGPAEPAPLALEETALAESAELVLVSSFGARFVGLADGTRLALFAGRESASDHAVRAARCALALRDRGGAAQSALAVATGRGLLAGEGVTGEVIDRLSLLLARARRDGDPLLDDATAGLLDARFRTVERGNEHALLAEQGPAEGARLLLGRATPCVGRERELGTLSTVLDDCEANERAHAVLVTGPAGMGKSRLRHEFLRKAAAREPAVTSWLARLDPIAAGAPLGVLGRLLRDASEAREALSPDARREALRSWLARVAPGADGARLAAYLGELVGARAPDDALPGLRAARQDARAMSAQLRIAWLDLLDEATRAGPLALVVEDLHWGDAASVELLDAALERFAARPLLLLALARPEARELFPSLFARPERTELTLGALPRRAAERLVQHALGRDVSAERVARILDAAGGSPFFLEELLRAEARRPGDDAVPSSVAAAVQGRLEALSVEARRAARAASVFGETFWAGGVRALSETSAGAGAAALAELVRAELVSESQKTRFLGEVEYRFRHALLRDAAYATLTEDNRALGHRLAAGWLEAQGLTDSAVLAAHLEQGGAREQAAPHWLGAARDALTRGDAARALEYAQRAAQGAGEDAPAELRGGALAARALALYHLGDAAQAGLVSAQAVSTLPAVGRDWLDAQTCRFDATVAVGDAAEMEAVLRELLEAAVPPEHFGQWLFVAVRAAVNTVTLLPHKTATSIAALERALEARSIPEEQRALSQVLVHYARTYLRPRYGELAEALRGLLQRPEVAAQPLDWTVYGNALGDTLWRVGQLEEAERCFLEVLVVCEKAGMRAVEVPLRINLTLVRCVAGRLTEARATALAALAEAERQTGTRWRFYCLLALALVEEAEGDRANAEAHAREALSLAPSPIDRASALAPLAAMLVARGRYGEALTAAEEALACLPPGAALENNMGGVLRLAHAEALAGLGEREAAREVLEAARRELLAEAEALDVPAWRESFLRVFPAHARILALHRAQSS